MTRDNDMQGRVFAISGGASGIGLATSKILQARGASVAIRDIDEEALKTARELLKVRVVLTKLGRLDGAANCPGIIGKRHGTRGVRELEDDQWDMIVKVNLTGMMYCLRAQLNAVESPGSIVRVSSEQGSLGFAKHAAYAASKHGILGLVRSTAKEEGARNVRVNAVTPGSIETPLMHKRNALEGVDQAYIDTSINRLGSAKECGNLIAWLFSDESTFVTGAMYSVDGGWAC